MRSGVASITPIVSLETHCLRLPYASTLDFSRMGEAGHMAADETEAERRREALARIEGRSPLHDWMRNNRAELEAQFTAVRRPRWASVAKVLAELGVKDARGQPPNPQTARQAWMKVRASPPSPAPAKVASAVAPVARAVSPAPAFPAAAPVPQPPTAPPRQPFDPTEGAFDPKPAFQFKPVRPK